MILFEGSHGTVLHSGDVRWQSELKEYFSPDLKIDVLYLDNTFATTAEWFPSQPIAYTQLATIIEDILNGKKEQLNPEE